MVVALNTICAELAFLVTVNNCVFVVWTVVAVKGAANIMSAVSIMVVRPNKTLLYVQMIIMVWTMITLAYYGFVPPT